MATIRRDKRCPANHRCADPLSKGRGFMAARRLALGEHKWEGSEAEGGRMLRKRAQQEAADIFTVGKKREAAAMEPDRWERGED